MTDAGPISHPDHQDILAAVTDLDPILLEDPHTRTLVKVGAEFLTEITGLYGTPDRPRWFSGIVETGVLMCYHNGGADGHSSVGPLGAGVPRAVLQIAAAMDRAAGHQTVDTIVRAAAFTAACAHDYTQLCGRSLLPEGHGPGHGDERLSADAARARCLAAGVPAEFAHLVWECVTATAFNPVTRAQNVDYDQDREWVLAQELTAAADLLSLTGRRGPLSSLEHIGEALCLRQHDRIIHRRLPDAPTVISTPLQLLDRIEDDPELRAAFITSVRGQAAFYAAHRYSDTMIRTVCGAGIDELFPGRARNVELLEAFVGLLDAGHTPSSLWHRARDLAGY